MGLRGPAPTPTPILLARESRRAKARAGEADFGKDCPDCPEWLGEEARAEWARQVKALARAGVLAECDRALLAAFCEAWGELVQLAQEIATHPGGYAEAVRLGLVGAKNKAVDRLVRIAGQFGFSPAARTRVKAVEQGGKPSGRARFFAG